VKIRKETSAALLVISAIALFIWGFNFMKGRNIFMKESSLYAIYERSAGLNINNPVLINGHQVGLVRSVEFIPEDPSARLIVRLGITSDIPIPADSRAVIETSLLGSSMINIHMGRSAMLLQNNDTLMSAVATTLQEQFGLEMLPVKKKAENLMLSLDTMLAVISSIFNEETRENLTRSMESIRRSIELLRNTTQNIDGLVSSQSRRLASIFEKAESIASNFNNHNESISHIINNLSSISDSLAKIEFSHTIRQADKAISDLSEAMQKINEGDGSLALLINDEKLYRELENSSTALNQLIRDINANPDKYVHFSLFGRKEKKKKLNESE
jgi:phospholipid/cholesterol/gamma-HCH transport system substrate-binding protein